MSDEISRIVGNIYTIANVEKVKEVTPRPEEGKNLPSPFNEVELKQEKDKRKEKERGKKIKGKSVEKRSEDAPHGDGEGHINIVI